MEIKQNNSEELPVVVIDSLNGAGKTGIAHGSVTCYIKKKGGVSTVKTINAGNWSEDDATNMPGFYTLTLSSSDTNTLGPLKIVVKVSGAEVARFVVQIKQFTEADLYGLLEAGSELYEFVRFAAAMLGNNLVTDQLTYDANGHPLTGRKRAYDNSANTDAAFTSSPAGGDTGKIYEVTHAGVTGGTKFKQTI